MNPYDEARKSYLFLGRDFGVHILTALFLGLGLYVVVTVLQLPLWLALFGCAVLTVLLVVFGIRLPATDSDGTSSWKLGFRLSSRESVLPFGLLLGLVVLGELGWTDVLLVVVERGPVIWLIMTFALLSYGLDHTGFSRYLAIWTLLLCRGSVARLTIGFFVLSSLLTYVASNDIVVLLMTPLVLELSRQSGIRDVRMILLIGCFIASNVLSMSMLLGSPSNLIVALAIGMNFFEYLGLMAVPSLVAGSSSLLTVAVVYAFFAVYLGRIPGYTPGALSKPPFTRRMGVQCMMFVAAIVAYSVVISAGLPFWPVSLVMCVVGLAAVLGLERDDLDVVQPGMVDAMASMPWGIVGFAFCFFSVSAVLVGRAPLLELFEYLLDLPAVWELAAVMGVTAILVNGVNDLPSSAMIGSLLSGVSLEGWRGALALQGILVSLNISCYLSPAAALAGLMWFHFLRRDGARHGMLVPKPLDLFWYGCLHFLVTSVLMCAVLLGANIGWAWLTVGRPDDITYHGAVVAIVIACVSLVVVGVGLIVSLRAVFKIRDGDVASAL